MPDKEPIYDKLEEVTPKNREKIAKAEDLSHMKDSSEGWKIVYEYLNNQRIRSRDIISRIDATKISPDELKAKFIQEQARYALLDEVMLYIEETINEGNHIRETLVSSTKEKE